MPVTLFRVRWPDQSETMCYSPSTIVKDYLREGESYSVTEFRERARTALRLASDRVRAKYGYACSRALDELAEIERRSEGVPDPTHARVVVLEID
jgi:uncharacterized repeat protein (TIGR04042 family)